MNRNQLVPPSTKNLIQKCISQFHIDSSIKLRYHIIVINKRDFIILQSKLQILFYSQSNPNKEKGYLPLPGFLAPNNFQWILPCSQSSPPCLHSNSLSGLQFSTLNFPHKLFVSSLTLLSLPQIQPKINNTNNKNEINLNSRFNDHYFKSCFCIHNILVK